MNDIPPDQQQGGLKVGFTGTQDGLTRLQTKRLFDILSGVSTLPGIIQPRLVGIHGDCIGADETFSEICQQLNGFTLVVRPGCDRHGQSPKRAYTEAAYVYPVERYMIRNRKIVDICDHMLGCPRTIEEEIRSGTWATIRYARNVGKRMTVITPDGYFTEYY